MYQRLLAVYKRQQFFPSFISIFVNPFFFFRIRLAIDPEKKNTPSFPPLPRFCGKNNSLTFAHTKKRRSGSSVG